jgi:rfaE bifunctional protein nucleotidyltransferase chain/domain
VSDTRRILASKVIARADAAAAVAALPRPVVFTNGVFDILHRGHVSYLHAARALGASLVVAVNTDASARRLGKGPERPLNNEADRSLVLAALESVSLVTGFDESTPVPLLAELRPQIYVKGGDYDIDKLEETRQVRSWGGEAFAIEFVDGYSTTSLVRRMRAPLRRAAFIDRDGVINIDHGYLHRWEDCRWVPGAVEGLRRLQAAGYLLIVVTNQSGIARGYYTEVQYQAFTERMVRALADEGVVIARVYHCPHHPDGSVPGLNVSCLCRKPAPGMLLQAVKDFDLDADASLIVGDKGSDIEAGRLAGLGQQIGVKRNGDSTLTDVPGAAATYNDLMAFAQMLVQLPAA